MLILDLNSEADTRAVLNIYCYCNIHFSVKQMAAVCYENKVMLISILILKAIHST